VLAATDQPAVLWTIAAPADFAWRAWDGEVLLYDARSGDVHAFDAAAGAVLIPLFERPMRTDELACAAAAALGVAADAELEALVAETLRLLRNKEIATVAP
jgi:PqqD family protein of HPr-rel-A system